MASCSSRENTTDDLSGLSGFPKDDIAPSHNWQNIQETRKKGKIFTAIYTWFNVDLTSQHMVQETYLSLVYFSLHYCCFKQIIFDSLFGKEPNAKLRLYAVQFVHHVCLWSSDKIITMMGPVLLNGMTKLISEDKQVWERENSLFLNVFCVCSVLQDHDCTINNKCSAVCISCRIPKYSIWPKDKVCKSFYNDFVGSSSGSKTKEVGIHSNWKTGKVSF